MNVFSKIRTSRRAGGGRAVKPSKNARSIFRGNGRGGSSSSTHLSTVPSIETGLTLSSSASMESDDINNDEVLTLESPKIQKISQYIFSEAELMQNELNHVRQLEAKQQEIIKLQMVHRELREKLQQKEKELADTQAELEFKQKELAETHAEMSAMDDDLFDTKTELRQTKESLNIVGSKLIQCQHELHEKAAKLWPW